MNEIGLLFRETRDKAGVSLQEASKDIEISEIILKNIEDGNIGSFKDISVLKEHIREYAKYLGLDSDVITDQFNNFMFEYTSKITIKSIERAIREKTKLEKKDDRIYSPYTKIKIDKKTQLIYIGLTVGILIVLFTIFIIIKFVLFI